MTVFAVIAGGGTSGHVLPALAVAEGLVEFGHDRSEVHYVGTRRGIETRLLPPSGFTAHFFDVVGLKREFSLSAMRQNLLFVPKLLRAWWKAARLLRTLRPLVVVSVGGYGSLPAVLAARMLSIPIVVITYDRTPGRSSAITSRFATAVASAFPESPLPRFEFTGAPVRRELCVLDRTSARAEARRRLGIDGSRFCVAVIGGSLGSGVLNDAVRQMAEDHAADADLCIRHVVGERFLESYRRSLRESGIPFSDGSSGAGPASGLQYQVLAYEDDMASLYAAADVVVGRGGAGTVAEIAATGTPAILVPWAAAAEDHQTDNVRWLADQGGAIHLPEHQCAESLHTVLDDVRGDPAKLATLGQRAHAAGARSREGAIAAMIERVAGRRE